VKYWFQAAFAFKCNLYCYTAASKGHNETVSALIVAAGAKLDLDLTEMLGCTPLWAAAEGGHKDVVLTLMSAGADTNVSNKFGRTALIAAALQVRLRISV
jgi:ankyrin repeat protein